MGNRESILQEIQIFKPPLDDLYFKDPGHTFKIYHHRYLNYEVMAHKVTLNDEEQLVAIIDNFKARYQHHYLVSTMFLATEDYSACGGYYETIIFYQRVFTNLSKIKDIPFQDVLHFYAVAFKGFQILYRRFGYFEIYEDMFHLGQDSKLKVWCNKDISKNQPQPYLLDKHGTEEDMIRKIIFIVSENTDLYTDKINLKERLFRFGIRNFEMVNQSLREICRQYNLVVSQRLTCISSLPSEEVKMMLDLYSSNSNLTPQNLLVSESKNNSVNSIPLPNISQSTTQLANNIQHPLPSADGFMTPHFNRSLISHAPITQQISVVPQSQLPIVHVQPQNRRQTQMSMIHTFNRMPQMPGYENRKGIDLSLISRQKKPSLHGMKLSQSRNRSLPIKTQSQFITQTPSSLKFYSLDKKPDIKINFVNGNRFPANPVIYGSNIGQRLEKSFYPPQKVLASPTIYSPQHNKRQNYHFPSSHATKILEHSPSKSRVIFGSSPGIHNPVRIQSNFKPLEKVNYTPILTNSLLNQSKGENQGNGLRKSVSFAQNNSSATTNFQKSQSTSNLNVQKSQQRYEPLHQQFRERRTSSKQKGSIQMISLNEIKKLNVDEVNSSQNLQKNKPTTPLTNLPKNILQTAKIYETENTLTSPEGSTKQINNSIPSSNKMNLDVPFNPTANTPQYNAHSASSRYLYSTRSINDNIPDLRNKKSSSPRKTINKLFDHKLLELQSFNQSKFGTQNSLKEPQYSRVLEIIGRDKKDSITSAFNDHQQNKKPDAAKDDQFQVYSNQINIQNSYKLNQGFTDPKILEILRKPSSKALKAQINNTIKKVSKTTKPVEFLHDFSKKPFISKEVREDMLKLQSWQIQNEKSKGLNSLKGNHLNLQGFPSLSNLSQINKADEQSFNEENKSNFLYSNKMNLSKKTRFSEQKAALNKNSQIGVSQFYNFDYQSPTYEYSFSSKKQIPIHDNEWRSKYATLANEKPYKDQSTMPQNKSNDYKMTLQKPFTNYVLGGFNSNESLASLQFELTQKLAANNLKDQIRETTPNSGQFVGISNDSVETSGNSAAFNNRKYNPKIDPEISKDLERFRKQRQQPVKL